MFKVKTDVQMETRNLELATGINRLSTNSPCVVNFIDPVTAELVTTFILDVGTHTIRVPRGVKVVVDCDATALISHRKRNPFNPFDPTRVEAAMIRPRTQKEELQDYVNSLIARTTDQETRQALASGKAEFDPESEDWSEDHEDDADSPLSVHQLSFVMDQLQRDIKRRQDLDNKQMDIEEEINRTAKPAPKARSESSPAPADTEESAAPPPSKPAK